MSDIDPQIVQPSPVPLTYAVETISAPQGNVIRLRIYTPTGAFFVFLPRRMRSRWASRSRTRARRQRSGSCCHRGERPWLRTPDCTLGCPVRCTAASCRWSCTRSGRGSSDLTIAHGRALRVIAEWPRTRIRFPFGIMMAITFIPNEVAIAGPVPLS